MIGTGVNVMMDIVSVTRTVASDVAIDGAICYS